MRKTYHPNYHATRPLVLKVFRQLRKLGFVAKPNFMCCGSCASSMTFEEAEETGKVAVAWWHSQDEESYREGGELYIGFGHVDDNDDDTTELGNQVGRTITKLLIDAGLKVTWTGSSDTRICVVGINS